MGRRKRPYKPGMIFHLTSRTHRREPLYTPVLRTDIADLIRKMIGRTNAKLLAYAVMPNHIHVVLRQGVAPLGDVMQPLLRRIAYRVQRHHGFDGGVVERRFRDRPCESAQHVREAVIYTHLNPWRAGLCDDDLVYPWTSHHAYVADSDPREFGIDREAQMRVLELFAGTLTDSRAELCRMYAHRVQWRMRKDKYDAALAAGLPVDPRPVPPETPAGDRLWRTHFASGPSAYGQRRLPDLRDFAQHRLARIDPDLSLDDLRGSWLPRDRSRIRKELLRAAATRGFRTGAIARFFDVSPQTVSRAKYESGAE